MASLGPCEGRCGVFCGYNKDCCKVTRSLTSLHRHHSHFSNCHQHQDVPTLCQAKPGFYSGMRLYHQVMSQTYQYERTLREQERLQRLGVTGIPFSHRTSVQGNPMRSADFKSSSKYHKNCSKEE